MAFLADLSDGTTGLYATDPSGGLVKIALEGDPLDGSTITKIHFTPDAVGERFDANATTPGLRGNCGTPGLNDFGEIAFAADLANGKRVIVRSTFEGNRPPGAIYVWDSGAGDANWHTISGGRSNWSDENGQPRDDIPPVDGTAEVRINSDVLVEVLDADIQVKSLEVTNGSIDLGVDCQAETISVTGDGSMVLGESVVTVDDFTVTGLLSKEGPSNARIEASRFDADDVPFSVEGGELTLQLIEGTFTDTPMVVEEGNLVLSGKFILDGEEAGITVNTFTGGAIWESGTIRLLSDAIFNAVPPASLIRWGGESPEPILLEVDERTTLTVTGAGRQELKKSLVIPQDLTVKIMNNPTPSGEGFVIDLEDDETLGVAWRLDSEGLITMYGGSLRTQDFGFVTVGGEFVVEDPVEGLDANFTESFVQLADVNYGVVRFGAEAKHRIRGATFAPIPDESVALYYNDGSSVETIGDGESVIAFDREEPGSFDASIELEEGKLELSGANMSIDALALRVYHVGLGAELTLKDFGPKLCRTTGGGLTRITGEVVPGLISQIQVKTEFFEIVDANFLKPTSATVRPSYLFEAEIQEGTMSDSVIGENLDFKLGEKTVATVEGPLVLASKIEVAGFLELKANIQDAPLSDGGGIVLNSTQKNTGLVIPANLPQPMTIEVPLTFEVGSEGVFVGSNSTLVLPARALIEVVVEGFLDKGTWDMSAGSRCLVTTSAGNDQILGLGRMATLKLKATTPGGKIFGDLPSFAHPFNVGGKLELDGTLFDMGGGTLLHRNQILMKNGAKVIGDVESVRDDVQGIVPLVGNINIEGNLTTNGTISLGASPGAGLVTGNVTLLPGSEMIVEFAGTDPGTEFDFLEVGGQLALDGKLTLKLLDEYLPPENEVFRFIEADEVTGQFVEVDQSEMGRLRRFAIASDANGVTATAEAIAISSFDQWRTQFFSPAEAADDSISGPNADPDGDGQSNLVEYATNGLPLVPGPGPLSLGRDGLALRWANGVQDYTWELSTSVGLESWEVIPDTPNLQSITLDDSVFRLEVSPAISNAPERYYRIEVVPVGN